MTFNFKHLDATGRKAWYEFPTTPAIGRIEVRHAGQTNKNYVNAVAKLAGKRGISRKISRGQVDADVIKASLDIDREIFPLHVCTNWSDIKDSDTGEPVPFTPANCRALLDALPYSVMKAFSEWANRDENFLPDEVPSEDDIDEQAGE